MLPQFSCGMMEICNPMRADGDLRSAWASTAAGAGPRPRRLLIVDPARRFGCESDQRFSDRLARAFCDTGFEVVWVIDADDPLPGRPYARLRRLLPPRQAVPADSAAPGECSLPARHAAGARDGDAAHPVGGPAPNSGIARVDCWARTTWKDARSSPGAKAAALGLWTFIRIFYRLQCATALVAWQCARVPRLLAHAYWYLHAWAGFASRAAHWACWRVAYPFLGPCLALARKVGRGLPRIGGSREFRRARKAAATGASDPLPVELLELLKALGPEDVLVLPSAELAQLDALFRMLPRLGLSQPLPATLHVRFARADRPAAHVAPDDGALLAARLRSGSPIRTIVLHAQTAGRCRALERSLGLRVHECPGDDSPAALRRRFAPASAPGPILAPHDALDVAPSLIVERLGPVALLVSALWGRVGSTAVFDAQTRYLLERGFIVARVLVDHYPQGGPHGAIRRQKLLAESFEKVRPHLHLVAERNESFRHAWQLALTKAYRDGSPVRRIGMELADATLDDPVAAAWCADRAVLSVVNHLPHVAFAERLAKASVVLETHDIYARLLTSHGIPHFVGKGPDGDELRRADEMEVWRRVAACVNLSPEEHAAVAPVARRSVLARPYVDRAEPARRSWLEVVAANRLPAGCRAIDRFDIMLWGDWHEGNVAGVRWFLEEVVDGHGTLREADILLVGRVAQGLPRRLLQRQGLHAVGFVDRIDDFFARSSVLVIPDRPGSTGLSVKAMDACARGCCFSSTAAGLRGVTVGDTGLAPSDEPAALARDIAHLLGSADARRARAVAARRLYDLNFSKAAYSQAWDAVLHALLPDLPEPARRGAHAPLDGAAPAPPPTPAAYPKTAPDRAPFGLRA
jgi:hypothetical protein